MISECDRLIAMLLRWHALELQQLDRASAGQDALETTLKISNYESRRVKRICLYQMVKTMYDTQCVKVSCLSAVVTMQMVNCISKQLQLMVRYDANTDVLTTTSTNTIQDMT